MNKKKNLLLTLLALALLLGGASALYARLGRDGTATPAAAQSARPTGGEAADDAPAPAPDFTVYDIDGNAVHLSDFAGTPVVLNFWASWCGPCRMIGPVIEELSEDYDGRADICKVNVDDEIDLAKRFRIMSIPCVILFKDGQEMNRLVGARDKEEYADAIDEIMG